MEMTEEQLRNFAKQLSEIEQFIDNMLYAVMDVKRDLHRSKARIDEMRRQLGEASVNQQGDPS